jgi:hypothetical protein
LGSYCPIRAVIEISVYGAAAGPIQISEISSRVTSRTSSRVGTRIAVIPTGLACHGGCVTVPSNITGIVTEQLRYIVKGVSCGTCPGLMMHVAELHLGEDIWGY